MSQRHQEAKKISTTKSIQSSKSGKSGKSNKSGKNKVRKKVLIGPKNNQIEFERIINAQETRDEEVLSLTTLMIKNIPIRFL